MNQIELEAQLYIRLTRKQKERIVKDVIAGNIPCGYIEP